MIPRYVLKDEKWEVRMEGRVAKRGWFSCRGERALLRSDRP